MFLQSESAKISTLALFLLVLNYTTNTFALKKSPSSLVTQAENQQKEVCPVPRQGGNNNYHSQFYEDYILSIVFADITQGAYVDVGANSPDYDSVTKYFYDQGWRGINIEPIKEIYERYKVERPEDTNINMGISNKDEVIDFYILSSDLMSTGNKEFALSAKNKGYDYTKKSMRVTTLNKILEEHPQTDITFIKIDVEGMEKEVLEGINLKKFRPYIFVIESIKPFSHKHAHEDWEQILLKNKYRYIYFDSLNRYYVSEERYQELEENFSRAIACNKMANDKYPEYKIENIFKHELDQDHPALNN